MTNPLLSVFVVASVAIVVADALPRAQRELEEPNDENPGVRTLIVLPESGNSFMVPGPMLPDLDDDDSILGFNPFGMSLNPFRSNPMDGFLAGMRNIMNTIKERMDSVMSGMPGPGVFVPWGNVPEGGNTTSTTKIIDGHVVTVNDTTYQSGDNDSLTFYRVRLIDVTPVNATAEDTDVDIETVAPGKATTTDDHQPEKEETTTEARSVETVEDFADNNIPDNRRDDGLTA